jgi:hypothetical protein
MQCVMKADAKQPSGNITVVCPTLPPLHHSTGIPIVSHSLDLVGLAVICLPRSHPPSVGCQWQLLPLRRSLLARRDCVSPSILAGPDQSLENKSACKATLGSPRYRLACIARATDSPSSYDTGCSERRDSFSFTAGSSRKSHLRAAMSKASFPPRHTDQYDLHPRTMLHHFLNPLRISDHGLLRYSLLYRHCLKTQASRPTINISPRPPGAHREADHDEVRVSVGERP